MPTKTFAPRISMLGIAIAILMSATSLWSATESVLYGFRAFRDGHIPSPGLISDSSGNLYGTTAEGGAFDNGTVFELTPAADGSWKREILYNFAGGPDAFFPIAGLTFGSDGMLYGTTEGGGDFGYGTVFELSRDRGQWKEKVLYSFTGGNDGYSPNSSVVLDADGNIYGTTVYGGTKSAGVVFELTHPTGHWTEEVLYSFCILSGCADGAYPNSVILGKNGDLYGATAWDGPDPSEGVVFQLTREEHGGWMEKILHAFNGRGDGATPTGNLIFDKDGNLYGATTEGGDSSSCSPPIGCGTVFELMPRAGAWAEKVIHSFAGGTDGISPWGGVVVDDVGDLYGATQYGGEGKCSQAGDSVSGCGTVFELRPGSSGQWTESVLHRFKNNSQGNQPIGTLAFDSAGSLYGTTEGNNYGGAIVFQLTPNSDRQWRERVLDGFASGDGASPAAPPTLASFGGIYGTVSLDGVYGHGAVFQLVPDGHGGWKETLIYNFKGRDGSNPVGSLIFDKKGNLYGTADRGGTTGCGVVFELSPTLHGDLRETVLHNFVGNDGCNPVAALVFDAAGNLYGTTAVGGASGNGAVFELSPVSNGDWSEAVLYSFTGGSDGAFPRGGLIFDATGNLYGTTYYGGSATCINYFGNSCGTVFELSPSANGGWTETVLYNFSATNDPQNPAASLIFDKSGNLYGTGANGGTNSEGAVFELTPGSSGWSESILYSFGENGVNPDCSLILDSQGSLYGTTPAYRASGGTVFELSLSGGVWVEKTLHTFGTGHDGADPHGGVVSDGAGHLYGTTDGGGMQRAGVVFEVTP